MMIMTRWRHEYDRNAPHVGESIEEVVRRLGHGIDVEDGEGGGRRMMRWVWCPPWWYGPPYFVQFTIVIDGMKITKVMENSR